MKPVARYISLIAALTILLVSLLTYRASGQMTLADENIQGARSASLQSYRVAQSLKALTAGYELTLNEYYSTVLDFNAYRIKSAEQRAAIDRELAIIGQAQESDAQTAAEIKQLYRDIDRYREELEKALPPQGTKDWDKAREALYKLMVLSVRGIHLADVLGELAHDRALALDKRWQADGTQAQTLLRVIMTLSAAAAVMLIAGTLLRVKAVTT